VAESFKKMFNLDWFKAASDYHKMTIFSDSAYEKLRNLFSDMDRDNFSKINKKKEQKSFLEGLQRKENRMLTHINFNSLLEDITNAFNLNLPDISKVREITLQHIQNRRKGHIHVSFNVSLVKLWVGDLTEKLNTELPTAMIDSFQKLLYSQAFKDCFTKIVKSSFTKHSVGLFPSQLTFPPVSYNEPWYNSKETALEVFFATMG